MDRFKKVTNLIRSRWEAFLKANWHTVPNDDYFRMVDPAFTLAGMVFTPTKRWERICWTAYKWLGAYHCSLWVVDAVDHLYHRSDFFSTVWPLIRVFAISMAFVRDLIYSRHYDSIVQSRSFINGKPTTSGDANYDYGLRKQYFRRIQMISFALLAAIAVSNVLCTFLISPQDKLMGLPRSMLGMSPWAVVTAHYLYITTLFVIWGSRNSAPPAMASALLDGYKTELRILGRGFVELTDHVQWSCTEQATLLDEPTVQPTDQDPQVTTPDIEASERAARVLDEFWMDLKQRVRTSVEQHVQLHDNLEQLQPCVEELFLIVYCTALALFGSYFYAPVTEGISMGSVVLLIGLVFIFAECFWWCNLVDSIRDVNETIELRILKFASILPHTPEHHSEYVQMRSTLMIMKMKFRNSAQFGCYEIITISKELFCELVNTAYTVFTFMMNMNHR